MTFSGVTQISIIGKSLTEVKKLKTRRIISVLIFCVFALGLTGLAGQTSKKSTEATGCDFNPEPGWMKSWMGQPGRQDQSASQPISKGTWMGCIVFSTVGSAPPACTLQYQNGGTYTLPNHSAFFSPSDDVVTLICNGTAPLCCKIQLGHSLADMKKNDPKVRATTAEAIATKK